MSDEITLLEADIEELLVCFPQLISDNLEFVAKRETIPGSGIIDLVFRNKKTGLKVLVEVKRGSATRGDLGQVLDYFGTLKKTNPEAEIVFVAKEIKESFKIALSFLGIKHAEFSDVRTALIDLKRIRDQASELELLRLQKERGDLGEAAVDWMLKRLSEIDAHTMRSGYYNCGCNKVPLTVLHEFRYQVRNRKEYFDALREAINEHYALLSADANSTA
ncbi:MAG: endonuclease NucS domain-containing protein [Candidatus Micrarchaeota archaeon]